MNVCGSVFLELVINNQTKNIMRIAYLISAYKDPQHLKRLIRALSIGVENQVKFFIHVDAKVDIAPFKKYCDYSRNIEFLDKRYLVQWGGDSQVLYQFELFKTALEDEARTGQYDRFVLMTAQDYPLMSNADMVRMYEQDRNKLYMRGLDKTLYHKESYGQFTKYHFLRDTKFRNPKLKQFFSFTSRMLFTILPIRKPPYIKNDDGTRWNIWQSSSYMSLTHECVEYICNMMEKNKRIGHYFKYSFVPEEKLIPTIIFNSPFKLYAEVSRYKEYRGLISLSALEEFVYDKFIKVYTADDYDSLINSGKMFCRKVETGVSDKLMDMLDEHNKCPKG